MEGTRGRLRFRWAVGLLLLPLAAISLDLAFRFPDMTENLYARGLYPWIARAFGAVGRVFPFSVAEAVLAAAALALPTILLVSRRGRSPRAPSTRRRKLFLALGYGWTAAGMLACSFLFLWGFNYARPPLEERMQLSSDDVDVSEVLALGERLAELTTALHGSLAVPVQEPTSVPFEFEVLDTTVDHLFTEAQMAGDRIGGRTVPAKRLLGSKILSYLGISGIFIPFTSEPSINALVPDATLPMVVAHEKAHQRGITHEGEANFAAFVACSRDDAPEYLRYSAYLFATRYLLGEASFYLPREEVDAAWATLGEGPRRDLRAIREFWERYEGRASRFASRVNDGYLRTLRVDEGAQSYGTVVQLLVALDRQGKLIRD